MPRLLVFFIALFVTCPIGIRAEYDNIFNEKEAPEPFGSLEIVSAFGGQIVGLETMDDFLFVLRKRGLEVFSIEHPKQPQFLSKYSFHSEAQSLATYRGFAYVGVKDEGVIVFDISDPRKPQQKSVISLEGSRIDLSRQGIFLTVFTRGEPNVYDLKSSPEKPNLVSSFSRYDSLQVWQDDVLVHLRTHYDEKTNTLRVRLVGGNAWKTISLPWTEFEPEMLIAGDTAIIGIGSELDFVNLANTADLSALPPLPLPGVYSLLTCSKDFVLLGSGGRESLQRLLLVDIRNVADPVIYTLPNMPVSSASFLGSKMLLRCVHSRSQIGEPMYVCRIFDISNPAIPREEALDPALSTPFKLPSEISILRQNNRLIEFAYGIKIIQAENGADAKSSFINLQVFTGLALWPAPDSLRFYPHAAPSIFDKSGDFMYVTNGSSIFITNLSKPDKPEISTMDIFRAVHPTSIAIDESVAETPLAWITNFGGPMECYDLADTEEPRVISSLQIGDGRNIRINRGTASAVEGKDIVLVDIHDPTAPQLLSRVDTENWGETCIWDQLVIGRYLVVAHDDMGLQIFDIFNPRKPKLVNRVPLPVRHPTVEHRNGQIYVRGNGRSIYRFTIDDLGDSNIANNLENHIVAQQLLDVAIQEKPIECIGELHNPSGRFDKYPFHVSVYWDHSSGGDSYELSVYDQRKPSGTDLVATTEKCMDLEDLDIVKDDVWIADGRGGLLLMRMISGER